MDLVGSFSPFFASCTSVSISFSLPHLSFFALFFQSLCLSAVGIFSVSLPLWPLSPEMKQGRVLLKIAPNQSSFIYYDPFKEHMNTQIDFHPPPGFEPRVGMQSSCSRSYFNFHLEK